MPLLMCPNDNAAMQTLERNGVQFDMCPDCRGVWLGGRAGLLGGQVSDSGRDKNRVHSVHFQDRASVSKQLFVRQNSDGLNSKRKQSSLFPSVPMAMSKTEGGS